MADLVVPQLGESITEAVVVRWLKQPGEAVAADEPVAELETDKITAQLLSPVAGAMGAQVAAVGATARGLLWVDSQLGSFKPRNQVIDASRSDRHSFSTCGNSCSLYARAYTQPVGSIGGQSASGRCNPARRRPRRRLGRGR